MHLKYFKRRSSEINSKNFKINNKQYNKTNKLQLKLLSLMKRTKQLKLFHTKPKIKKNHLKLKHLKHLKQLKQLKPFNSSRLLLLFKLKKQ